MKWNISVVTGKEINRDIDSSGERIQFKLYILIKTSTINLYVIYKKDFILINIW